MSSRMFRILIALSGILGAVALVAYFAAPWTWLPLPLATASPAEVQAFSTQYHDTLLWDTWLQAVGSLLSIIFAIGLVHLAGANGKFAGRLILPVCAVILGLSLMEGSFALGAQIASDSGHLDAAVTCLDLTYVFVHIVLLAPSLFLTLGAALLGTRLLPTSFVYVALALGALFQILGFIALFSTAAMQATIIVLMLQEVWSVAVAIMLIARPAEQVDQMANTAAQAV